MSIKVKLLRKLTRRPYGLAKFRVGKTWYSKIVRFSEDTCEWMGGTYSFKRDAIVIEKNAGRKKVYRASEWVNYEEGYPVIYFDVNKAEPLHFEGDPTTSNLPTAKAIQATMKKWLAAKEMELMRKTRSKLMLAIIITLIISMINMMVSIYTLLKVA